jgi:quinol monooxygenase YgiN
MPVKIIAFVTVKPGSEDAYVEAVRICAAASRKEPGALHYELWREADGERRYVFNELFSDDSAVRHHMASDHFKAFALATADLTVAPPTIIQNYPIDVAG